MFHPSTFTALAPPPPERRRGSVVDSPAVLIRPAEAADERAIAQLSALDERELPAGDRLIAELGGMIVAALDVRSGRAIADPFVPTSAIVELLGLRAAQVRR